MSEQAILLTFQPEPEGMPLRLAQFNDYLFKLDEVYRELAQALRSEDSERTYEVVRAARRAGALDVLRRVREAQPRARMLTVPELTVVAISLNSPLKISIGNASKVALTFALVISGGTVEYSSGHLKVELPPISQGIKGLEDAFGLGSLHSDKSAPTRDAGSKTAEKSDSHASTTKPAKAAKAPPPAKKKAKP